jgi:type IV pilus assembly protein PilM
MGIFEEKYETFGLDISDASVKVFQFKGKSDNLKPIAFGEADLPAGVVEDGKILRAKTVSDTISNLLSNTKPKKIKSKNIICALPESNVYIRIVDFPKMSAKKIEEAIKWEAEQYIPFKIEDVNYDWEIVSDKDNKLKILIAAAPKKILENYMSVFKPIDLNVLAFDLESRALARALVKKDEKNGVLIVDLGARSTTLTVFDKGYIQYTASIPVAGNSFTEKISNEMNVDIDKAEKIKRECGLDIKKRKGRVFNILQSALAEILREIQNTVDFYVDQDPDVNKVGKVVICGGSSNLPKLINYFKDNLKQKVELGDPCGNLSINLSKRNNKLFSKKKALSFASCVGLALRGVSSDSVTKEINLVNQEKQIAFGERGIRKQISFIAGVLIIFSTIVIAAYLAMWGYFVYENNELSQQIEKEQQIFQNKDPENLEGMASEFNRRVRLTEEAYESKIYTSKLIEELEAITPEGVEFVEFEWESKDNTVIIHGKGKVRDDVLTFENNLTVSDKFTDINIPLSTFEARENVPFDVSFKLSEKMIEELKQKP